LDQESKTEPDSAQKDPERRALVVGLRRILALFREPVGWALLCMIALGIIFKPIGIFLAATSAGGVTWLVLEGAWSRFRRTTAWKRIARVVNSQSFSLLIGNIWRIGSLFLWAPFVWYFFPSWRPLWIFLATYHLLGIGVHFNHSRRGQSLRPQIDLSVSQQEVLRREEKGLANLALMEKLGWIPPGWRPGQMNSDDQQPKNTIRPIVR
jgi:hypothetical protein